MSSSSSSSYQNSYVPVRTAEPSLSSDPEIAADRDIVLNNGEEDTLISKIGGRQAYVTMAAVLGLIVCASLLFIISSPFGHRISEGGDLLLAFDRAIPFQPVEHPEKPTSLWGAVSKPYPTGAFWTNFVVKDGVGPVGLMPYGIQVLPSGVQVSYGATRRSVNKAAIIDTFFPDVELSANETYVSRYVQRWDNFSVTMKYEFSNGASALTPLVKGSPFVTMKYFNATPMVRFDIMHLLSVEALEAAEDTAGSQYIVTLGNWQKWLVYISDDSISTGSSAHIKPEKVSLSRHPSRPDTLIANRPQYSGYIRVCNLPLQNPKEAALALLTYVRRYPTAARVTLSYPPGTPTAADLTVQFSAQGSGSGPLLSSVLPHHVELMKTPDLKHGDQTKIQQALVHCLYSTKGRMTPVVGDTWTVRYPLEQVGWKYSRAVGDEPIATAQMDEIADSLLEDVQHIVPSAPDPYAFGKQLGRMAMLALIADELGIPDARQITLSNLKTTLTPWLLGQNQNPLRYDSTWGGVVPSDGLLNFNNDFGAGWYSDHHFQFGYFVYAMAAVAKLDQIYLKTYRAAMDSIVRDICNPFGDDTDFPFARHKDLFDGHSWASGLFHQGNGKGQESSSEAVNAYYGAYLYGLASGNADFTKFAQTMLTMEVHATKTYWHMSPSTTADKPPIYDSVFAANLMVGNMGAIDVTASTWFGSKLEFLHGINMMPLTPATALLFDQEYVRSQWPVLGSRLIFKPYVKNIAQECSAHPECVGLGITGLCCPTGGSDPVMLACCNGTQNIGIVASEWLAYIYADHAVIDREAAWTQVMSLPNFGAGGSKTNSLYWTATRPPALGVDYSGAVVFGEPRFADFVEPSCGANSACDVAGLTGDCCPTAGPDGIKLGCCPTVPN